MASSKRRKQRPFRRQALDAFVLPALRLRFGPGENAWRYTVTVPLEEIKPAKIQKATARDLINLQEMCAEHFGGFACPHNSLGYGLRDPAKPYARPEMNFNAHFAVLAAPIPEADASFRALRDELEKALNEGVILIERQDVWIP